MEALEHYKDYIKLGVIVIALLYFFSLATFIYFKFGRIEPENKKKTG